MIEEKESVSRVHKSSGIYRFQVENYSGLSIRVGDSIESPEFTLCGYTWQLRIFPGGSLENHKGYLSYYLASKSNRIARASYKLSVVNQIMGGEDESFASSGVRVFEAKGVQVDGWGRDKFMHGAMLRDAGLGYRVDDTVVFKVEVTVYGDLEMSPVLDKNASKRYPSTIDDCLRNMFNRCETSDVTFYCGEKLESVHAHKCILAARSDVFKAMFFSSFLEHQSRAVEVPDIDAVVMREVLHHIYTDILPDKTIMADNAKPILLAALKYQLPHLIECTESYIMSELRPDAMVIPILLFAEDICCCSLKKKVIFYIAQNAGKIMQLKEFQELTGELLVETNATIEFVSKKRGCRGSAERERKTSFGCIVM